MIVLSKLLLAHLLGDFILQKKSWVEEKEKKKHRSFKLFLHSVFHGVIALIFIGQFEFWTYALFIAVSHWLIDYMKIIFQKENTRTKWFIIDQLLHVLVIIIVALAWTGNLGNIELYWNDSYWIYITAIIFITIPSSIIIRILISEWNPNKAKEKYSSLVNAGKWIGILERLFVFYFVISDHWEAIGFLLAAKSVFRFGDLKEAHDIKLTEYILIGTLLSFGTAILTGVLLRLIMNN
jgi:hypothetical protein